ncbi:MAG: hypothetical protein ND807_05910 [Vicinamibacterales bacterium]|nr:hypothetical protein [Vicinamibacterales bacterium]
MGPRVIRSVAIACALILTGTRVFAQEPPDVEALRVEVARLRQALEAVEAKLATLQVAPPSSAVPAGASKAFNPDTSVLANFVGVAGRNPASQQPALQLSEVEVAFQADVDPYARADFFLSAGPEGLEIEEGFVTFTTLPASLLLKVGKMRAQFGKVNALHTHRMPTADRPLVSENLFGGEEGLSDSGFSLSKLVPNSFMFLEATGEVFLGASNVFQTSKRSDLNYVGRLRAYHDLSEGSNIDLGSSVAFGPTNVGPDLNKRVVGLDATFRYKPLRRAIYRQFQARTELMWSHQEMPEAVHQDAFGLYGLGEYQFARRWYIGGRYDRSQRALDASIQDTGGSVFLTYWPSEFSQIRGQYRHTNYGDGVNADEVLFQFNFAIGAHGAHVF